MAKNSIRDYSATASSNTDIQSVDIDENCAASGINNAIREVMADLKDVSVGTVALESPKFDSILDGNIKATDASGTDAAGTATTIKGGAGTGTGAGGSIIFQVADGAGSTGSSVNAHATAMTITDDGNVDIAGGLNVGTIKEATGTNTAMTIDSDGVVKITQNPCFFIKGNNQSHITTSPIVFGTTVIDTRSGVDLANNKYVVPVAGKWHFHLQLGIVSVTGTGSLFPYIRRTPSGGSSTLLGYSYYNPVNAAGVESSSHIDVDIIVDCAVGDSIDNTLVQTNGTYFNGPSECRFFGYFLG